jgi:GNAT superfamily N-acetyltransferase
MTKATYRPAAESDVAAIKTLTDSMLEHTGLGVATVAKIRALVISPATLVQLAFVDELLVGFVCGVVHESVFNATLRVSDIGLYVAPEHRKADIAAILIANLESWAKQKGASQIWLGQTTGDYPKLVERFYNRLGYKTKGFNCLKEL